MTWLDDDDIQRRLQTTDADLLREAIEAIELRLHDGELDTCPPLHAAQLAPLARVADYGMAATLSELLLRELGAPHELLPLVAEEFGFDVMHAVAMRLKVGDGAVTRVQSMVLELGRQLHTANETRVLPVSHFLECLLEGQPEIRAATQRALETWPKDGVPAKAIAEALH